jgi:Protein of unknown function (DUF3306)
MTKAEHLAWRWSRLKREAAARKIQPAEADGAGATSLGTDAPVPESFDPAQLPPIESITAGTDISAFLQSGVPPVLTQAALRRAWVSEPEIRDFIGIAENQWNFNDPTAILGFGPIHADEVLSLVAQALGTVPDGPAEEEVSRVADPQPGPTDAGVALAPSVQADPVVEVEGAVKPAASDRLASNEQPQPRQRLHGSALPK